jgi:exodeoxyribonuclease VII small subunit
MKNKLSFEESLESLEAIVERLESGDVPLEESLKLYEKGAKLAAACYETLQNAQQKITELSRLEKNMHASGGVQDV